MSAPFTTVAPGTDLLSLAVLNELVLGLTERLFAAGLPVMRWTGTEWTGISTTDPADCLLSAGDDVQHYALWSGLQAAIENLALDYCDLEADYGGAAHGGDLTPNRYTGATFLAHMTHGGWRRAREWAPPSDPDWLDLGTTQPADIIGPWLLEDLQQALSLLAWRWGGFSASNGARDV
mgnify:CR=1 FL=1